MLSYFLPIALPQDYDSLSFIPCCVHSSSPSVPRGWETVAWQKIHKYQTLMGWGALFCSEMPNLCVNVHNPSDASLIPRPNTVTSSKKTATLNFGFLKNAHPPQCFPFPLRGICLVPVYISKKHVYLFPPFGNEPPFLKLSSTCQVWATSFMQACIHSLTW